MSERRRIARASLVLWIGLAAAHASAEPRDWLALEPGRTLVYEVHRDHSFVPEQGSIDRIFHGGRSIVTMRSADAVARGAVALEQRLRLTPIERGSVEETFDVTVLGADGEIVLHGSGAIAKEGGEPPVLYRPPLRLLPTDAPGESWKVGAFQEGQTKIELRGEIVGIGNLDEKPGCEGCLQVRYHGPLSGRIPIYGGEAEITKGRFDRTVWYRRGAGIVRDQSTIEGNLLLPDKTRAKIAQALTLRLVEDPPSP